MSLTEFWNHRFGWQISLSLFAMYITFFVLGLGMGWWMGRHIKK